MYKEKEENKTSRKKKTTITKLHHLGTSTATFYCDLSGSPHCLEVWHAYIHKMDELDQTLPQIYRSISSISSLTFVCDC
jgi:hypothetical protein